MKKAEIRDLVKVGIDKCADTWTIQGKSGTVEEMILISPSKAREVYPKLKSGRVVSAKSVEIQEDN